MSHLLRFSCKPRLYWIESDGHPFDGTVDGVRVYESLTPSEQERAEEGVSDYRIVVEAEVETGGEARSVQGTVLDLARDLERIWTFVVGEPLFPGFMEARQVVAPKRWETNFDAVKESLIEEGQFGSWMEMSDWSGRTSRGLPIYPLEQALKVRRAYQEADEKMRYLVELFYEYEQTGQPHAALLILAKCTQLVDAIADGPRDTCLPESAREDIPLSFPDLWELQNRRRELRHPVRKDGQLWPELASEEKREYRISASIGVRDFVAVRLGGNIVRRE